MNNGEDGRRGADAERQRGDREQSKASRVLLRVRIASRESLPDAFERNAKPHISRVTSLIISTLPKSRRAETRACSARFSRFFSLTRLDRQMRLDLVVEVPVRSLASNQATKQSNQSVRVHPPAPDAALAVESLLPRQL